MSKETTEIEVEVVEIDGAAPIVRQQGFEDEPSRGPASSGRKDWRQWQGRVRTLDSRWWPLWVVLGVIALFLLLTLGLVFAVLFIIARTIHKMIRLIIR